MQLKPRSSIRQIAPFRGQRLQGTVSNGCRCRAFFNFKKQNSNIPVENTVGTMARDDYTREEVEDYFNYMGMLAAEGNYDRMEAMLASGEAPVDLLLLMACSENDTPKVEELLSAGANPSVKDLNGKTAMDLCNKEEIKEMLRASMK